MLVVNEADEILSICLVISSENFSIGTNNSRVMSWLHAYECNTTSFISYWRCICSVPSSSSFNGEIFWLLTRCFPQLFCVVKPVKEKFDSHRKKARFIVTAYALIVCIFHYMFSLLYVLPWPAQNTFVFYSSLPNMTAWKLAWLLHVVYCQWALHVTGLSVCVSISIYWHWKWPMFLRILYEVALLWLLWYSRFTAFI